MGGDLPEGSLMGANFPGGSFPDTLMYVGVLRGFTRGEFDGWEFS